MQGEDAGTLDLSKALYLAPSQSVGSCVYVRSGGGDNHTVVRGHSSHLLSTHNCPSSFLKVLVPYTSSPSHLRVA